jgi:hypothetical protein
MELNAQASCCTRLVQGRPRGAARPRPGDRLRPSSSRATLAEVSPVEFLAATLNRINGLDHIHNAFVIIDR